MNVIISKTKPNKKTDTNDYSNNYLQLSDIVSQGR